MDRVRFGTLGAARITPMALVRPARAVDEAEVVAVAARSRGRAEKFAAKHRIPQVHDGYAEILADPDVDAVYNPLPNSLHAEWTMKALEAGKHVLCEKPFTSNAAEAREVAAVAERSGKVLMEAFHWRYHPLAARVREIVESGEIGALRHVEAALCFPLVMLGDIRWKWDLAGGALMDAGCYTVSFLRHMSGEEPAVVAARARTFRHPQIDRRMEADFEFPSGATGRLTTSLLSRTLIRSTGRVVGDSGEVRIFNPFGPQYRHRIKVRTEAGSRVEHVTREPTYNFQLRAFCAAVIEGEPTLTPPDDAIANMSVIDAVYEAAGLQVRACADRQHAPGNRRGSGQAKPAQEAVSHDQRDLSVEPRRGTE
ncbi:MAG: Gfo/Idh/MocA family oxidoreductase [Actinobacteria bacterium]|nr:Gfo/Idh/MocA family oxidoreductase [Actinomycetota bacterium]